MSGKDYSKLLQSSFDDCKKEYQTALLNLEKCMSKTKDLLLNIMIEKKTKKINKQYELAIQEVISVTKLFKDFNIQVDKKVFGSLEHVITTISSPETNVLKSKNPANKVFSSESSLTSDNSLTSTTLDERIYEEPPSLNFNYPRVDMSSYHVNYEGDCLISFVRNSKTFFIVDYTTFALKNRRAVIMMNNFFRDNPQKLMVLPTENEVFGIYLDGYLFRAVKEKNVMKNKKQFRIFLIDAGDILMINFDDTQLYPLDQHLQKVPAQAMFCTLDSVPNVTVSLEKYLEDHIYTEQKFIIKKIRKNILHVELRPEKITNPFLIKDTEEEKQISSAKIPYNINNPFINFQCDISPKDNVIATNQQYSLDIKDEYKKSIDNSYNSVRNQCSSVDLEQNSYQYQNDYRKIAAQDFSLQKNSDSLIHNNCNNIFEYNNNLIPKPDKDFDSIHELLFEEDKTTENALEAVMGYYPKDDQKICKFYDPSTKSCFKGARCKLEHIPPVEGGWSREKAPTTITIKRTIVFPNVGEIIKLIPTHIVSIDLFYGQLISNTVEKRDLNELNCKLNSVEYSYSYIKFTRLPVEQELVIALYVDNMWYRARVLSIYDDTTVKIYFVDYGNCSISPLSQLRMWNKYFEYLPFQAISFRIADILPIKSEYSQGVSYLKELVLNRPIEGKVVNNMNEITVKINDPKGKDVAESLINKKFAIKQTSVGNIPALRYIPG